MKIKQPSSINFAVFIIFFGVALIEALRNRNWLESGIFIALGLFSLLADFKKNQ